MNPGKHLHRHLPSPQCLSVGYHIWATKSMCVHPISNCFYINEESRSVPTLDDSRRRVCSVPICRQCACWSAKIPDTFSPPPVVVGQLSELHGPSTKKSLVGKPRPTRDVDSKILTGPTGSGRHGPLEKAKGSTCLPACTGLRWKLELDKSQAATAYTPTSTSLTAGIPELADSLPRRSLSTTTLHFNCFSLL